MGVGVGRGEGAACGEKLVFLQQAIDTYKGVAVG